MIYLKWWKGRTYSQEKSTQQDSYSDLMEKSKAFRQAEVKRIQHHQTSFTTNAKGTYLGKNHKGRKRLTQNKSRKIKKMIITSYILVITLKVNGLSTSIKRNRWGGCMKTYPKLHVIILYY